MTRVTVKPTTQSVLKGQAARTAASGRQVRKLANTSLIDLGDTSALTSAQIDSAYGAFTGVSGVGTPPADGATIHDAANNIFLVRQGGKWCKTSLTVIA